MTSGLLGLDGTYSYDGANRLVNNTVEQYGYGASNQRLWKRRADGVHEVYLHGLGGELLEMFTATAGTPWVFARQVAAQRVWFGGRLMKVGPVVAVADRLGSYERTYPYGELPTGATGGLPEKFATYGRDATGLDYAVNRYYSPQMGRFLTPDPSGAADPFDPSSWNLYAYVGGDPINFIDPEGLIKCSDSQIYIQGQGFRSVNSFFDISGGDQNLLSLLVFAESGNGTIGSGAILNSQNYFDEKLTIGQVAVNRFQLVNGQIQIQDESNGRYIQVNGWGFPDGELSTILGARNQFDVFRMVGGSLMLSAAAQSRLSYALSADSTSATCENLVNSAFVGWAVHQNWQLMNFIGFGINTVGVTFLPTSFNSFGSKSSSWEVEIPGTRYGTNNRFYGTHSSLVSGGSGSRPRPPIRIIIPPNPGSPRRLPI